MGSHGDREHGGVVERTQHQFVDDTLVSTSVVTAVARAHGVHPTDLPPLFDTIDPEALDALVTHHVERSSRTDLVVTFVYEGCEVTVHGDGEIVVSKLETPHR